MTGFLGNAASVLHTAAERMPIAHLAGAEQELTDIVQFAHQAGGQIGEQLAGQTMIVHEQVRTLLEMASSLRDQFVTAATHIQSGMG